MTFKARWLIPGLVLGASLFVAGCSHSDLTGTPSVSNVVFTQVEAGSPDVTLSGQAKLVTNRTTGQFELRLAGVRDGVSHEVIATWPIPNVNGGVDITGISHVTSAESTPTFSAGCNPSPSRTCDPSLVDIDQSARTVTLLGVPLYTLVNARDFQWGVRETVSGTIAW